MEHAEQAAFDEQGHAEQGDQAALDEQRVHDLGPAHVRDEDRRARRRHAPREALADGHAHARLDLLLQPSGPRGNELVAGLVQQQDHRRVRTHDRPDAVEQVREQAVEVEVCERGLGDHLELPQARGRLLCNGARLPLAREQDRVVDGQRGAAGELGREHDLGLGVAAPGLRPGERERPERARPRDKGDGDGRSRIQLDHQLVVPLVARRRGEGLRVELREHDRLAAAHGPRRGLRRVDRRLVERPHLAEQVLLARVDRADGDLLDRDAVLLEHVDDAPVGERRHGQPRDLHECLFPVERAREHLPGLGQEADALVSRDLVARDHAWWPSTARTGRSTPPGSGRVGFLRISCLEEGRTLAPTLSTRPHFAGSA